MQVSPAWVTMLAPVWVTMLALFVRVRESSNLTKNSRPDATVNAVIAVFPVMLMFPRYAVDPDEVRNIGPPCCGAIVVRP